MLTPGVADRDPIQLGAIDGVCINVDHEQRVVHARDLHVGEPDIALGALLDEVGVSVDVSDWSRFSVSLLGGSGMAQSSAITMPGRCDGTVNE